MNAQESKPYVESTAASEDAQSRAYVTALIEQARQKGKERAAAAQQQWAAATPPPSDPRWALWDEVNGIETGYCYGNGEFEDAKNARSTLDYLAKALALKRFIRPDRTPAQLADAMQRWEARKAEGAKAGRQPTAARKDGPFISGAVLKDDSPAPNPCTDPDARKNLVGPTPVSWTVEVLGSGYSV